MEIKKKFVVEKIDRQFASSRTFDFDGVDGDGSIFFNTAECPTLVEMFDRLFMGEEVTLVFTDHVGLTENAVNFQIIDVNERTTFLSTDDGSDRLQFAELKLDALRGYPVLIDSSFCFDISDTEAELIKSLPVGTVFTVHLE